MLRAEINLTSISFLQQFFVLIVRHDPEPDVIVVIGLRHSSATKSDSCHPHFTDSFEPQRGMILVVAEQFKTLIREFPNRRRKFLIAALKLRCGEVVHSGVQRPAL